MEQINDLPASFYEAVGRAVINWAVDNGRQVSSSFNGVGLAVANGDGDNSNFLQKVGCWFQSWTRAW